MKARLLAAALTLLATCAVHAQSPAQRLNALAEQTLDREFELGPLQELFAVGRGPNAGKAIGDATNARGERQRALYRDVLAKLRDIPRDGLSPTDANTHDILRLRAENQLALLEFPLRQIQLLMPGRGLHGVLIYLATAGQPLQTQADYETWLERIEATAKTAELTITALEEAHRAGWLAARVHVDNSLRQMDAIVSRPADQGPLWAPIPRYPKAAGDEKRGDYEKRYREALEQRLLPALRKVADYLRNDYRAKARAEAGIGRLRDGDRAYRTLVRFHTTLDMTPDEVHEYGLAEMARITPRLLEVARGLGFRGEIKDFEPWLQSNAANFPFKTEDEVLDYLRKAHARIEPGMPKLFRRLPKAGFEIRLTPKELAATASATYSGPPEDGSRPGYFNMPVPDPRKIAAYTLVTTLLHEGMPGHHLDIALRRELPLSRFRKFQSITAYGEGWGLYSEGLGHELGMYDDPWSLLGRYSLELRRAARLVTDTGIHAKGWTREQAIRYLMESGGQLERIATVEVERYMADPGQALAYKIGEREILALRDKARAALGDRFDFRDFHEAVLGEGPLPLMLLRRRVEGWIASQR